MHLSNLPENLAFFSGAIDAAGSFGGIYQSAVLAYGSDVIKDPPDPSRFADTVGAAGDREVRPLQGPEGRDRADPHQRSGTSVESDPLLSKDIRFLFEPNAAKLDMANQDNIRRTSRRSSACCRSARARRCSCAATSTTPRSRSSARPGGEAYVRTQALRAMELSKNRAGEIRQLLIETLHHRPQAHRHRRPRLGRAGGTQLGSEPPRRSAVVHGRVS